MIAGVDKVLRALLGPDDWLGRHEAVCFAGIFLLALLIGAIDHAI